MFNLADYEPVEVRLEKFIKDYPSFRISTELEVSRLLDTSLKLISTKMRQMLSRGQQGTLRKQLLAEVLIRLQHWRIARLRQSAEHLQMQVMRLKEKEQAARK